MRTWTGWLLVMLATAWVPLRADDPDALTQALALEKVMQKIIVQAEPSIACILVSRSELYRKLGQGPDPDETSGRLGVFNADVLDKLERDEKTALRPKLDLAGPTVVPESFGSGVVVDPAGLILTNYHVIQGATKIFVRLPGGKGSYADIHAADPRSDLAVLRVLQSKILPLPAISLGDGGKLQRGQFVLSLANPYAAGFRDGQPSASWGILSNIRRRAPGQAREEERVKPLHHYGTLLQTDARLNLGTSGGALLNLQGELVGLTTALAAIHGGETPGGFAIPMDAGMRRILDVLLRGEEVDYGFLGVGFDTPTGQSGPGIPLNYITPGSPAQQQANFHSGDRILSVSGIPVRDVDDLFLYLGTHLAGSKVVLEVRRPTGPVQKVEVTMAKFYVPGKKIASSLGKRPFVHGLRVDYTSLIVQQSPGVRPIPAGVLVTDVQPGSAAAKAQIRPGEVITQVNNIAVTNPPAFYQLATRKGPVEFMLAGGTSRNPASRVVLP